MSEAWKPRDDQRGVNESIHPRNVGGKQVFEKKNTAKPQKKRSK
jgi:hypothetical protein